MRDLLQRLDNAFTLRAQRLRHPWVTQVLKLLTWTGAGRFWLAMALGLNLLDRLGYTFLPEQRKFLFAYWAPLLAFLVGRLLKNTFRRQRPSGQLPGFMKVLAPPPCGSFPSSHTSSCLSFATFLLMTEHPWGAGVLAWALVVSFSRLYLGVHWLTDILGGALLGIACGLATEFFW
jgi:undecaprenyl-diphosphatase